MSAMCPDCDLELNGGAECPRCASAGVDSLAQADMAAEGDIPFTPDSLTATEFAALDAAEGAEAESAWPTVDEVEDSNGEHEAVTDEVGEEPLYANADADDDWPNQITAEDEDDEGQDAEYELPDASSDPHADAASIVGGQSRVGSIFNASRIIIGTPPAAAKGPKDDDEKALLDFTEALPPKPPRLSAFASDGLSEYLDKLREERLVLISCPDEDLAFSAAHALIERLELPRPDQKLLLNISKAAGEGPPPSIYYLRGEGAPRAETVVLVDAATEKARQFLEPIIHAAPAACASIQGGLRQNGMYMICLIEPAQVGDGARAVEGPRQARDLKFPCWRIAFLRPLLAHHLDGRQEEIEAQILKQRERGWWSFDESEFYFELKSLLLRGGLEDELKRREEAPPPGPAEQLFSGDDPLSATVLYVATFFPNLTPYEFNRIVLLLLARRPAAADGSAEGSKDHTQPHHAPLRAETALQTWRESPDQVLEKYSLVTIPLRGAAKGVNFSNYNIREKLRDYLDRKYSFFLENKFRDVQELGLLFSPSGKVAEGAVRLCVEMAAACPEHYGSKWLAWMVASFESDSAGGGAGAWRFIEESNPAKAGKRFYHALSDLIRAMLEDERLVETVDEFLHQLLLSKHHGAVLEIVRRLQFAPAFDQFKWLKQLIHRGNPQMRAQTYEYLRTHLKKRGGRAYQILGVLESWLPEAGRPLENYPLAAWYALRLLRAYLSEATLRFDPRYFGTWPSACPLFAFRDADAAARDLHLLTRLIFHPGMRAAFEEQRAKQGHGVFRINSLITHWFFILLGNGERGVPERGGDADDAAQHQLDADSAAGILLEQIARAGTATQRAALHAHWREEERRMLSDLGNRPYGAPAWAALARKREIVVELITRYERLCGVAGLR